MFTSKKIGEHGFHTSTIAFVKDERKFGRSMGLYKSQRYGTYTVIRKHITQNTYNIYKPTRASINRIVRMANDQYWNTHDK